MHLCLRADGAMSCETQAGLEKGRRAQPDGADSPRSGLADGDNVELLCCRDAAEMSAPFKFRRYG